MTNEFLLIFSLVFSFASLLVFYKLFGKSGIYCWCVFSTISANIEVLVLVNAFGMEQTLGNTLFASTFLATDILSEVYGKKYANKAVSIGIASSIAFIVLTKLWVLYIPSENDKIFPAIKLIFSNTPRLMCASFVSYAISEFFDVWAYHRFWELTTKLTGSKDKFLWLRNNGATIFSQLLNIVIFNFGAFFMIYDFSILVKITISCFIIYIFTSLLDTPFIYLAKKLSKQ